MKQKIKTWMAQATVAEQEKLARLAKTSRGMLYQLASGQRNASAEYAARLESAFDKMHSKSDPRRLTRADISETCAACHFAKACQVKNSPNKKIST